MAFLEPAGPHGVGSVVCRLADASRPAHLGSDSMGRELIVKVWYPSIGASTDAELVWEELRGDARTPWAIRLLLKLSRARTSTHVGAAFDTRASIGSIVVYNHGLISFASENASLLEHLASRGHVAVAVRHVEQLAELQWLTRGRTVLDRVAEILRHVPGVGDVSPAPLEAHLVGFSLGGAVSNEVAARDSRAKSVANSTAACTALSQARRFGSHIS